VWRAFARAADGNWLEERVVEIPTDGPFQSRAAFQAAREAQVPSNLLAYLGAEAEVIGSSRDAIETWAPLAEAEAKEFDWAGAPRLKSIEEAVALFPSDTDPSGMNDKPRTLAWHDHTAVLIVTKALGDVRLLYVPDPEDERRVERLRFRYGSNEHRLETVFDWRGYFGTNSAVVDGWELMRQSGRGYAASFVGAGGFVVGTVLRRLTKPPLTLNEDRSARPRRIQLERKYRQVATSCPDLSDIDPGRWSRCMVFIHGTVSCGIVGLKDLFPSGIIPPADAPVFRFEHDTFQTIQQNASDLVSLVRDRLVSDHLLFVAHSRGGLVAKLAAEMLRKAAYQAQVLVYTFGTPHLGTPLVAMGTKALNLLFKIGEDFASTVPIPVVSALTKGYSYAVDAPTLPPGIDAMSEQGPSVGLLQALVSPNGARSWASNFSLNGARSGFSAAVEGLLLGALMGRKHDLVVPLDSALAFGTPEPALSCSHVRYFVEPVVSAAIKQFLQPSAVPVAAAPPGPTAPVNPTPAPSSTASNQATLSAIKRRGGGVQLKKKIG